MVSGPAGWLEDDFRAELDRTIDFLRQVPQAGPVVLGDLRRVLVHRFPFAIYYRLQQDMIEVRAILHTRRDPTTWRRRA
jgi:plasmid stabilization system protein ParE